MNFHVTCELDYTLQNTATFLFALRCIETGGQQILGEPFHQDPNGQSRHAENFLSGRRQQFGPHRVSRLPVS